MNIIKWGVFVGLICLLVACNGDADRASDSVIRLELPPRYGMLCNFDSTSFLIAMPSGSKIYDYDGRPFKDVRGAVERAWRLYNWKPSGADTTKWNNCK